MAQHFADRLAHTVRKTRTCLCVGLDPRWESLPLPFRAASPSEPLEQLARGVEAFCCDVLELIANHVGVVKPQSAFFEALGPAGMRAQQSVLQRARDMGFLTILDAKRGDIASTATAYAEAAFAGVELEGTRLPIWDADALTINPYLGKDAVEPFMQIARQHGRGLFVLVRTSNPGADLFQDLDCQGRRVFEVVGEAVGNWANGNLGDCGYGDVGAVVGATHPRELQLLREQLPNVWFLVPGYGAQGGSASDVRAALRFDGLGAIVNSSRGVTFPFQPEDPNWKTRIVEAVQKAVGELRVP